MSGMDKTPYFEWVKTNLPFEFKDIDLLITALTHRSYVNEHKKSVSEHNERLEFLGDAVLELVTTDYLYKNYDEPEGILTSWRSSLVRTESISEAGVKLGYEPLVRMSRGEKRGSDRARAQILANCFEAVVGAIYLDQDYQTAEQFIHDHILVNLQEILETGSWRDPKSYIQELMQKIDTETPNYKVLAEEGPDHEKTFTVGVFSAERMVGQGVGPSKQAAQQAAAKEALKLYRLKDKELASK